MSADPRLQPWGGSRGCCSAQARLASLSATRRHEPFGAGNAHPVDHAIRRRTRAGRRAVALLSSAENVTARNLLGNPASGRETPSITVLPWTAKPGSHNRFSHDAVNWIVRGQPAAAEMMRVAAPVVRFAFTGTDSPVRENTSSESDAAICSP